MKIENLKQGMVIKNYKELCSLLEVEYKKSGSNTYKAQLKKFNCYFDYEKEGQKFIITKIHHTIKDKTDSRTNNRGGNHKVFVDDFKKLMIYTLHKDKTESMLISKGALSKAMSLVNENYRMARVNIPMLSKIIELPEKAIYEFYDTNSSKINDTLERNLKKCRRESLFIYETVTAVAVKETLISKNELNQPIVSEFGELIYDVTLRYREATKQEKKIILKYENEIKNELNLKDNREIFLKGKWTYFKSEIEKRLKDNYTNIQFYYDAYKITWLNEEIEKEFIKLSNDISIPLIKENLNNNMIKSIKRSIKTRHTKALSNIQLEINDFKRSKLTYRVESTYIKDQSKISELLISKDAESIETKKNKVNEKLNPKKIQQLELNWDINSLNNVLPF